MLFAAAKFALRLGLRAAAGDLLPDIPLPHSVPEWLLAGPAPGAGVSGEGLPVIPPLAARLSDLPFPPTLEVPDVPHRPVR